MSQTEIDKMLERLQKQSFAYFKDHCNPANGLVCDRSEPNSPASIAATGFALTVYLVGAERGWLNRRAALKRVLTTARFFTNSLQSAAPNATGRAGFYYHFLDIKTGLRANNCELSTIDTTLLLYGFLAAAEYFNGDNADEVELRELVAGLVARVDWTWACNGGLTVTHGYRPRRGFIKYRWDGYSEALPLYILGLGSPTHPLPEASYAAWQKTYDWKKIYDLEYVYAGPMFIHQFPHVWLDLRGVQDEFMRRHQLDYFENSRRATCIQQQYAIRNPHGFHLYSDHCWGLTACDGPGPARRKIAGKTRSLFGYRARGAPFGPDDGTVSPWAVVTSLPFAPEIVLPTMEHLYKLNIPVLAEYGFKASFNPSVPAAGQNFWMSRCQYGINQGPMILMIENFRSGLIWKLMRQSKTVIRGLQRAGFAGGWLDEI